MNTPGTIDSDYRGEIKIILFNHGKKDFIINNKDRVAQMILTPVAKIRFEETDNLPDTVRVKVDLAQLGMKSLFNKKLIERFSRQIVLKDIGVIGPKKFFLQKF